MRDAVDILRDAVHLARPFGATDPDPALVDLEAEVFDPEEDGWALTLTPEGRDAAGELERTLVRLCRAVDPFGDPRLKQLLRVAAAALLHLDDGPFPDGEVTASVAWLLEEALEEERLGLTRGTAAEV